MVKVYSNCPSAELFVNGESAGTRQRDSENFPAAGLRWMVKFNPGKNHLRVDARKGEEIVKDEIEFDYQLEKWGKPARFHLAQIARDDGTVLIQATLHDSQGVQCLDSRATVRVSIAGMGALHDNLGTSNGSGVVQLYNGRVEIRVFTRGGSSVVGIASEGIPATFLSAA